MVEVSHNDFMRAVYHHELDVKYSCEFVGKECRGQYTLGSYIVCRNTGIYDYKTGHKDVCYVAEWFKRDYIDTTPDDAYRCRSCSKRADCKIIRQDLDCFCIKWHNQKQG